MKLDNLNIKIIREFYKLKENEETTTWGIMRKLYPKGRDLEENRIKYRIKKMAEVGLFLVEGNSPKMFSLILDNVIFKKQKFPDKIEKALCLKICDKWEIFEL